jgi:hypothetical protein
MLVVYGQLTKNATGGVLANDTDVADELRLPSAVSSHQD